MPSPDSPRQHGLRAFLRSHAYGALSSLGRFLRAPVQHALTLGVIGSALALPLLAYLALDNARLLAARLSSPDDLSVFLRPGMDADVARALARQLEARAEVAAVTVIPPEQAVQEFRDLAAFASALDALGENPLPFVLSVRLAPGPELTRRAERLAEELGARPEVELAQYDRTWLIRLHALLALGERALWVFGGLLALAVLLVIGNTIRLEIAQRRDEIVVIKLVGGSDGFVQRPFLYAGFWFGLFGALTALLLVWIAQGLIEAPIRVLSDSYGAAFQLHGLDLGTIVATLLIGVSLGWSGALLASARHLRETDPH